MMLCKASVLGDGRPSTGKTFRGDTSIIGRPLGGSAGGSEASPVSTEAGGSRAKRASAWLGRAARGDYAASVVLVPSTAVIAASVDAAAVVVESALEAELSSA